MIKQWQNIDVQIPIKVFVASFFVLLAGTRSILQSLGTAFIIMLLFLLLPSKNK